MLTCKDLCNEGLGDSADCCLDCHESWLWQRQYRQSAGKLIRLADNRLVWICCDFLLPPGAMEVDLSVDL